jgi:hypothetical protein
MLGGGGGRGRGKRGGFGIHPDTVHPSPKVQGKGYKRAQFEDAWQRYLTTPPSQGANRPYKRTNPHEWLTSEPYTDRT